MSTVLERITETPDTVTLRLALPEPSEFLPGQYFNVRMPVDGMPRGVQRSYSVASSPYPDPSVIDITVKEMLDGLISPRLVREVQVGDTLEVRGAYGKFAWTELDVGPVYLIGAGSGIVPLVCIIRYAVARGLTTPMQLLYSSRTREDIIYRAELAELEVQHEWLGVDHALTRDEMNLDARYRRRIDAEMIEESLPWAAAETWAYICGPPPMVETAERSLHALGVAADRVLTEKYD